MRVIKIDDISKEALKNINEIELQNKIYYFDDINFKYISDEKLYLKIKEVIGNDEEIIKIQKNIITIPKGTILFRVRKLDKKYYKKYFKDRCNLDAKNGKMEVNIPECIEFDEIKTEKDLWNPPSEKINTYGRINEPKESLLYLAIQEKTALIECNVNEKDISLYSRFLVEEDIKINFIGELKEIEGDSIKENQRKLNLIDLFLKHQFSREVGEGKEYLYRISGMIAKKFFYTDEQDGWGYGSIADKEGYNLWLEPKKVENKLKFIDSRIGVRLDDKNQCTYIFNLGVLLSSDDKKLYFYPLTAEEVKYRFQNIKHKDVIFSSDYFEEN